MNNKKLFEEAIAEAKSIREAAIANAKEALEESLTPQIKSLLAQRLAEMEEEDEDSEKIEEVEGADKDEQVVAEAEDDKEEEESEEESEESEESEEEESEEPEGGESEEEVDIEDMSVEELKQLIRDIVGQMVDGGDDMGMEEPNLEVPSLEEPAGEEAPEEEEIDLDELLAELTEEEEETISEFQGGYDPSDSAAAGLQNLVAQFKKLMQKGGPVAKKAYAELQKLGAAAASGMREGESEAFEQVKSELNEAKKTIKSLSSSLQEVNLLNAKLLYVNKVLKSNKNLTESQVANVIATFDKATTTKEVKLIFESLNVTLEKRTKAPVVESKLKGLASKPVGNAPTKEVITEVSEAVKRMQKLAGIIK